MSSKQVSSTIVAVFSMWSVRELYNEIYRTTPTNENVRTIGKGEARHRKYKRLKLGGGQAYDRSID
jgi:hypothetical protein